MISFFLKQNKNGSTCMQISLLGDDRNQFVRRKVLPHTHMGARTQGRRGQIKSNTKLRFMFSLVGVGVCRGAQCEPAPGTVGNLLLIRKLQQFN